MMAMTTEISAIYTRIHHNESLAFHQLTGCSLVNHMLLAHVAFQDIDR